MHLGAQELILILVIVLVLFGGKKVAGLGKALGTSMREFKEEVNKDEQPADTTVQAAAKTEETPAAKAPENVTAGADKKEN